MELGSVGRQQSFEVGALCAVEHFGEAHDIEVGVGDGTCHILLAFFPGLARLGVGGYAHVVCTKHIGRGGDGALAVLVGAERRIAVGVAFDAALVVFETVGEVSVAVYVDVGVAFAEDGEWHAAERVAAVGIGNHREHGEGVALVGKRGEYASVGHGGAVDGGEALEGCLAARCGDVGGIGLEVDVAGEGVGVVAGGYFRAVGDYVGDAVGGVCGVAAYDVAVEGGRATEDVDRAASEIIGHRRGVAANRAVAYDGIAHEAYR